LRGSTLIVLVGKLDDDAFHPLVHSGLQKIAGVRVSPFRQLTATVDRKSKF
jgi:hypothetical protein